MATQLPAKLRTPELQRFATRAAQLEKYKPIVTYWCEYYILQQLLGKNLHTTDDEAANYAVQLMDKLEQTKSSNASNDAIIDDVAAKAYVENFALETFSRADNAQRANAVTKQTADTFMAAATFLDLLSIWGQPDQEITAKSKFAKFHALRIAKAFKAGEDPNATNPVVEEQPAPPEDGIDAELKELERQESSQQNAVYQAPTVEQEPEDGALPPVIPQQTPVDTIPTAPPLDEKVSPIEPPESSAARQNSIGGGYFPTVSSTAPSAGIPDVQAPAQSPRQPTSPHDFYASAAQPPSAPPIVPLGMASPDRPHRPGPNQATAQPPAFQPVQSPPTPQWQQPAPSPAPVAAPVPPPVAAPVAYQQLPPASGFRTDDESTMAASKHARWAISALNFEDVNTAVKELRLALQSLGAG